MNKQELIDKAVEELSGKLPPESFTRYKNLNGWYLSRGGKLTKQNRKLTHADYCEWISPGEFTQRARELGWCNGYKYGVEYETNGKKPDLPSDVKIIVDGHSKDSWLEPRLVRQNIWASTNKFRIVDDSCKPAITQENKMARIFTAKDFPGLPIEPTPEKSWHEKGELPPVGVECEVLNNIFGDDAEWEKCLINWVGQFVCVYTSDSCNERCAALEHVIFRPLKTERESFVEAAISCLTEFKSANQVFGELYDAGFKAPEVVE